LFIRFIISILLLSSCQQKQLTQFPEGDITTKSGWVSVFQTLTSENQTNINILKPRFADLAYYVEEDNTKLDLNSWARGIEQKIISTVKGPQIHWNVDRILIKNLDSNKKYRLLVVNKFRKKIIDYRYFNTLKLKKSEVRFILGSCMSDSHAFEHVRNVIWDKMLTHNADFLMLLGDQVYVDDFDFVKRDEVSEFDLWTRYIDSFRKIPLFQNKQLIPILSVWDDHDFGTNNSNKTFKSKEASKKVYSAFFGGESIPDVYEMSNNGISFSFNGYNQKFILMDDRYYREVDAKSPFGEWGKDQHKWFFKQIDQGQKPIWLANGGQFFTRATFAKSSHGKEKQINESFIDDYPTHFKMLLEDIKKVKSPILFLSGDIHYSEISQIDPNILGYKTYEISSSPIHSFIYREEIGPEKLLNNPNRILSVKEHNYMVIDSKALNGELEINIESYGVKQTKPYFEKKLKLKRN
jgi:alkaline phosphatase D